MGTFGGKRPQLELVGDLQKFGRALVRAETHTGGGIVTAKGGTRRASCNGCLAPYLWVCHHQTL
jgi:hypothetical protein